jgi:hypothetical protein
MGSLNGGNLGYPVTFQILFEGMETLTATGEIASAAAARTFPWAFKAPSGYAFYIVSSTLTRYMAAPSAGYLYASMYDADSQDPVSGITLPRMASGSDATQTTAVSSGACKVPDILVGISLIADSQFAQSWGAGSKATLTLHGYLREV